MKKKFRNFVTKNVLRRYFLHNNNCMLPINRPNLSLQVGPVCREQYNYSYVTQIMIYII